MSSRPGRSLEAASRSQAGELPGKLAGKSLPRQVVLLAIWPLLEQLLTFVVNSVDIVMAGRMAGNEPETIAITEALAVGGFVTWLLLIIQGAAAMGATAVVSRATGGQDFLLARRAAGQALLVGFLSGLLASGLLLLTTDFLVDHLFHLQASAREHAARYLQVMALACPFSGLLFAGNSSLRGSGDTRTPFLTMVLVGIANILLTLLLVFGAAPFGGFGIVGLAAGTALSWALGAITVLSLLLRAGKRQNQTAPPLYLRPKFLTPDWSVAKRILNVGLPGSGEMVGMWAIQSFILANISRLSQEGALGAHLITLRIESFSFLPGFAMGTAAATLAGQYLGAGNPEKAQAAVRLCWRYAAIFMSCLGMTFFLGARHYVAVFTPESETLTRLAMPLIILAGFAQPLLATAMVLKVALRGVGATRTVLIGSYSSMFVFRLAGIWLLMNYFEPTLFRIWAIMFLDVAVQAVIFSFLFFKGTWLQTKV
ncbi:MAG: MATE family efflux transporter [Verrucomicrobiota bacterium]